jgi:hypothetical protein
MKRSLKKRLRRSIPGIIRDQARHVDRMLRPARLDRATGSDLDALANLYGLSRRDVDRVLREFYSPL